MQELAHQFLDHVLVLDASEHVHASTGVPVGLALSEIDEEEATLVQLKLQVIQGWYAAHEADVQQSLHKQRVVVEYQIIAMRLTHFL
jgi:hypothetical protein